MKEELDEYECLIMVLEALKDMKWHERFIVCATMFFNPRYLIEEVYKKQCTEL